MAKQKTIKNFIKETRLFQRRLVVIAVITVILCVLLIVRLFYLQIMQHDLYTTLSRQNQFNLIPIEANRGLIYDRNGVLLAENIPIFSLEITPERIKNLQQTIAELQKIIEISPYDITQFQKSLKQRRPFQPAPLKMRLTDNEVAKFYVDQYRFPGVSVNAHLMRYYPLGSVMTPVLGYVGRISEQDVQNIDTENYAGSNYIGKTGIEKHYESILHGTVGYKQIEIDASGRIIRTVKRIPTIPGENLYLTIDSNLQIAATQALGDISGAVVVIQPKTGQVLALVSNPSYDPNQFVNGISPDDFKKLQNEEGHPLYNRATRGQFPIASTIKPYMAITGLNYGVITPTFTIHDPGWFMLPGVSHVWHDWQEHGHGIVNVSKAVTQSCDTFMYTLGVKLGIDRIYQMLSQFGYGHKTGIDLDDELPGLLPTPAWKEKTYGAPWFEGDTVSASIGQGYMLTTPLQMAQAISIVANRGGHYRPYLLMKIRKPDGTVMVEQPTQEPSVVLTDPSIWDLIIKAMQAVVSDPSGTAYRYWQGIPYTAAAKTGTAQLFHKTTPGKVNQALLPKNLRNHSLFVIFAPVDKPQIAVAVVAENSLTPASVIARKVLDYYFITEHHEQN